MRVHKTSRREWSPKASVVVRLRIGILFLLILKGASVSWAQGAHSEDPIPFEVNRNFGSILIHAQIDGHPATLVVDTGSSHTILSSDLLQVRPLALPHADDPTKGSGYVGSAGWAKATVAVGTNTWRDRRVLVMNDFRDMSN